MGLTAAQLHRYVVSLLARGFHVDTKDDCGRTALMHVVTAKYGDASTIEILLKENADIYTADAEGSNALSLVIEESHRWLATLPPEARHLKVLAMFFERVRKDFLIDRQLTVQRLRDARCPMALVPFVQNASMTKYIYQQVWDLMQYNRNLTILHGAILVQDVKTVRVLIESCVQDLNDIPTALFAYNVNSLDTYEKIEMLTILLDRGVSLYEPRLEGLTPIKYLLKNGSLDTRLTLLRRISPEKCKYHKVAALHYLLENEQNDQKFKQEIGILLSRGFDINMRNEEGMSVLIFALKKRPQVADFLIRNGAEVNWIEIVEEILILNNLDSDRTLRHCNEKSKCYKRVVESILQHQFDINFYHLFRMLNKEVSGEINDFFYMQVVISNYAISEITQNYSILRYVPMRHLAERHYDFCQEKIKQLKTVKVCDSVTLFELLTVSDDDIDKYTREPNFVLELQNLINQKCFENLYYIVIIRKRIENALKIKKLRRKASLVVCQLTGLNRYGVGEDHYVVYKIVNYLSKRDIFNLFEGQSILSETIMPTPDNPWVLENWITRTFKKIFL